MDKHNNPSNNINNSNDNPREYQANEVENTQEIPVVNDESPRGNGDSNTHSAPEYTPSTYAPETKQESHLGRNLFVGAVAAVAVTAAAVLFNGNTTNAASSKQPSIEQSHTYEDEESYTEETLPDNAYEMQDKDPKKVYDYNHSDVMNDGLDASEIASSMGYDSLLLAVNSEGTNEVANGIITSVADMGYASGGSWDMTPANGKTALRTNYGFSMNNGNGGMTLYTFIQDGNFYIQLLETNNQGDNIASYDYNSDVIPTPDEAAQLLADNQ